MLHVINIIFFALTHTVEIKKNKRQDSSKTEGGLSFVQPNSVIINEEEEDLEQKRKYMTKNTCL